MKFWLTVTIGVVLVAGITTTLLVMSPNLQQAPVASGEPQNLDIKDTPKLTIVGDMEVKHENVGQEEKGQDIFEIRNDGNQRLELIKKGATCQCTDLFFADRKMTIAETPPTGSQFIAVPPGKSIYVMARWDTKQKIGEQTVGLIINTNDPRKRELTLRIHLTIFKEVIASAERMDYGQFNEGDQRTNSMLVTSQIRDSLDFVSAEFSSPFFKAQAAKIPAQELNTGKAGIRVTVDVLPNAPAGIFSEMMRLVVRTKGSKNDEKLAVVLTGQVLGEIEVDQGNSLINFREVTESTNKPIAMRIFARRLKAGEKLKLGEIKPDNVIAAKLEKDPASKFGWILTTIVKPDAKPGIIRDGRVTVLDPAGKPRLVFRVQGIVDSSVAQSKASL